MIPDAVVPMRVQSLHRYPVKSMLGETLNDLFVDERGAEITTGNAISAQTGLLASR
ncbi:MAG: N-terminal beta barrel domain [Mycobacterium sp.]|jgi:hypothetical protein|nr:N-terminal beta barrel domain [Mycobacterium sp.]MDT5131629.1 N-terminal beta barrel domain [Mycobacterium sp.]